MIKMDNGKFKMEDEIKLEQQPIVMPAVSPEQALEAWKKYQALKEKIKTPEDIQLINGKEYLKKSYWRKVARFFNLSIEIVDEKKEDLGDGKFAYNFRARAIAPNGVFAEGAGSCDNSEKGINKSIHNTRTIAETRAWNRAVSNLVGAGEVSAEEMDLEAQPQTQTQAPEQFENSDIIINRIKNPADPMTEAQGKKIYVLMKTKSISTDEIQQKIKIMFGKASADGLTKFEASKLISFYVGNS